MPGSPPYGASSGAITVGSGSTSTPPASNSTASSTWLTALRTQGPTESSGGRYRRDSRAGERRAPADTVDGDGVDELDLRQASAATTRPRSHVRGGVVADVAG